VNGAPDFIMKFCTHYVKNDGMIAPLTNEARDHVLKDVIK
jgi:hypothetical protein